MMIATGVALLAQAQRPKPDDTRREIRKANNAAIDSCVVLLRLRHDVFLKWKESGQWPDDKDANKAGRAILAGV